MTVRNAISYRQEMEQEKSLPDPGFCVRVVAGWRMSHHGASHTGSSAVTTKAGCVQLPGQGKEDVQLAYMESAISKPWKNKRIRSFSCKEITKVAGGETGRRNLGLASLILLLSLHFYDSCSKELQYVFWENSFF